MNKLSHAVKARHFVDKYNELGDSKLKLPQPEQSSSTLILVVLKYSFIKDWLTSMKSNERTSDKLRPHLDFANIYSKLGRQFWCCRTTDYDGNLPTLPKSEDHVIGCFVVLYIFYSSINDRLNTNQWINEGTTNRKHKTGAVFLSVKFSSHCVFQQVDAFKAVAVYAAVVRAACAANRLHWKQFFEWSFHACTFSDKSTWSRPQNETTRLQAYCYVAHPSWELQEFPVLVTLIHL